MAINTGLFTSDSTEWETPQEFFDELDREFGFDLDVCAQLKNAKLSPFFSPEDDGLSQDWTGTCWMNPPYGRKIGKWVAKAKGESEKNGATVVCLLPARTDTRWWHDYIWDEKNHRPQPGVEVRLIRGRLKFVGSKYSAPFPSAVIIFREG